MKNALLVFDTDCIICRLFGIIIDAKILILSICKHSISFHLFVSSQCLSASVLSFSKHKSFASLVRFIPRYCIFILMQLITVKLFVISLPIVGC